MRYPGTWVEDWPGIPRPAGLWVQSPWGTRAEDQSGVPGPAGF